MKNLLILNTTGATTMLKVHPFGGHFERLPSKKASFESQTTSTSGTLNVIIKLVLNVRLPSKISSSSLLTYYEAANDVKVKKFDKLLSTSKICLLVFLVFSFFFFFVFLLCCLVLILALSTSTFTSTSLPESSSHLVPKFTLLGHDFCL